MRRKRTFITVLLVIGTFMLCMGYAAISNITLNINGNATAIPDDENFTVKFDNTVTPTVSDSEKVTAQILDDTTASISVTDLISKGNTVTATYTIKNESPDLSAVLTADITTNSNGEYFKLTHKFEETVLKSKKSTTVTITVELLKTPTETDQEANVIVTLTASPKQP